MKSVAQKWVCLLPDRSLAIYDSPTTQILLDRISLGHAIRIAPGGTHLFVQTVAGNRIEMRYSEPSEMDKWTKALSTLKRRTELNIEGKIRKNSQRIPDHDKKSKAAASSAFQDAPVEVKIRQDLHPLQKSDNDSACNVLHEIAGSNLSDDEYDPEEDAAQPDLSKQLHDSISVLKGTDVGVREDEHANQAPSSGKSQLSLKRAETEPPFASSSSQGGAQFHRAFIQFNEGVFALQDRTMLKSFFGRYGEVTDVYLPQTNRKVNTCCCQVPQSRSQNENY